MYLEISNCINLETLPTDIYFESLGALDLSGCSRLRSFPNISTNISYLFLNRTGIEEVPWWIETFTGLKSLCMNGCNKLHSISLHMSKLQCLERVEFSDCGALTNASLNGYKLPIPHEASSSLPDNYFSKASVDFFKCFKLDQEALIQKQLVFCKLMMLSGERVPSYFTHRATGTSPLDISLLHAPLSQGIFKFKVCVVVDCESVPMTHDTFSIMVRCRFVGRLGNLFDVATPPLYVSNLKLGSQLVIFEFSILLNEEKARVAELYYVESMLKGYLQIQTSQVYPDYKLRELDLEEPPQHEVQYSIKEWGIEAPIPSMVQNETPSFMFGSSSSSSRPTQNVQQKQQFQQFMEMFGDYAQVQGNNFGQGNFSPKQQFNNFQQGYQDPNQAQENESTSLEEIMIHLLLQQLMESTQKQNAPQEQEFQQKKFVEMFQNNGQVQGTTSGQGNFLPKQQFNITQQLLMESQEQKSIQGHQLQQKQLVQGFQNNAHVQGTNFVQGNLPPKQQFNNFQEHYQASIQTQENTPTTPQESKTDILLQQLIESQKQIIDGQKQNTKETKDLNVKMEGIYNDLNGKFESLVAHVRKLEVQVTQTVEAVKKQAETEAKTFCNTASIQEENDYMPISKQPLKLKEVMILPKPEEPRKFLVPYSIDGFKFNEFLCDTGTNVNVMSKITADEKRFLYLPPSKASIEYAASSSTIPHGFLPGVLLQIGNCFFPIDFHIVEMKKDKHKPLVLGYDFLAVVGALVDSPNKRISFTKIDKNVFYPAVLYN